jgi:hypothetical protein
MLAKNFVSRTAMKQQHTKARKINKQSAPQSSKSFYISTNLTLSQTSFESFS